MSANCNLEKKVTTYYDCNGDPYCVETYEEKAQPIPYLKAPLTDPADIGGVGFSSARIVNSLKYDKRYNALLEVQFPLKINTIFKTKYNGVKYYISNFEIRTKFNTFVYRIKRADCSELVTEDFNNLVKSRTIYTKGYFVNQ